MITRTHPALQSATWQQALADAVSDPAELLALLDLPATLLPGTRGGARQFPLRVPRGYVARMRPGDPDDPLLRQVLPWHENLSPTPGFVTDPVGDLEAMPVPGLLHKYHGRVLLVATGACAIHCRYCFRRHFPYAEAHAAPQQWQAALAYIRDDSSIEEVILSGGDPLSLADRRLADLARALADIPHLRRLRIHTRQPIVLPERVDAALLDWLTASPLQKVIVLHCNHANELDAPVRAALRALRDTGAILLNQAVLLRGVNDHLDALTRLSRELFEAGVLPYYLHLLDRVTGAAHFEVAEGEALTLHARLNDFLPGYLVPRLVREVPGALSKLPVT